MNLPDPWYVEAMTANRFILGMLSLGKVLETSLVGSFEDASAPGRGSLRDVDLPLHRDGVFSAALAAVQGGHHVERPGIDYVGLYCLRAGEEPCYTTLDWEREADAWRSPFCVNLKAGEALVLDNRRVMHGRRGPVGRRVLLRVWVAAGARA